MTEKTQFQQWRDQGGKLTPLPPLWQRRRERLPTRLLSSRPYLKEAVADGGDAFSLVSLLGVVAFVFVIGTWLYSARGMVGGLWGFIVGDKPSISAPAVGVSEKKPIFFSVGEEAQPPQEHSQEVGESDLPPARPDVRRTGGGDGFSLPAFVAHLAAAPVWALVVVLVLAGSGLLLVAWGLRAGPLPIVLPAVAEGPEGSCGE